MRIVVIVNGMNWSSDWLKQEKLPYFVNKRSTYFLFTEQFHYTKGSLLKCLTTSQITMKATQVPPVGSVAGAQRGSGKQAGTE